MKKRYQSAVEATLTDIFPTEHFRLVPGIYKDVPSGYSELTVEVDVKKGVAQKLSFSTPWDGNLYGFVRSKEEIFATVKKDDIIKITLADWDETFVMIFEDANHHEEPVYLISTQEVIDLLEGCMKPKNLTPTSEETL